MTFEIGFNRLYIIKSLTDNEMHSAEKLCEDVSIYARVLADDQISVQLKEANSKADILSLLDDIAHEIDNGTAVFPAIHFECHGESEQRRGLVSASRELITWEELGDKLYVINKKTHNQLFITMAVCHGVYLLTSISLSKAPFWGFVGPDKEAAQSDLLLRYDEFYRELFTTNSFDKAMDALLSANDEVEDIALKDRANYGLCPSTKIFVNAFVRYEAEKNKPENIRAERNQFYKRNKKMVDSRFPNQVVFSQWYGKDRKLCLAQDYVKYRKEFFMLNEFDNKDATLVPDTYEEFKKKFPSPLL